MGKLNVQSVLYICTLGMTDKASSKLLTSTAKEIVYNVSEHFRNENKNKKHSQKIKKQLNKKNNNGKM